MQVRASGEEISFEIEDEHGNLAQFQLGRRAASAMVLLAVEEIRNLPPLPAELHQETQPPFLRGYPATELGVAESGDIVLSFRLDSFPTMQFLINDDLASTLADDFKEIIDTPRSMRHQPRNN